MTCGATTKDYNDHPLLSHLKRCAYFVKVDQDSTITSLGTSTSTSRGHNETFPGSDRVKENEIWVSQYEWTLSFTIKQNTTCLVYWPVRTFLLSRDLGLRECLRLPLHTTAATNLPSKYIMLDFL